MIILLFNLHLQKKCLSLILELLHLFTINAIVRHVEGLLLHTFQTWKLCLGAHTHLNVATQVHLYEVLADTQFAKCVYYVGIFGCVKPSSVTHCFIWYSRYTYICFIFFETNLLYSMFRKLSTIALKLMSHNKIKNHRSTNHHHW